METKFVKEIGTQRVKNPQGDQYGTVHLVQPCSVSDCGAIQISPTDCVGSVLWGHGEVQRDVWDQHSYKIVPITTGVERLPQLQDMG